MTAERPCPPPDPAPRPAGFAVPPGACDCHVHVFGPAERYPYGAERSYTPPDAPPDALLALQDALGLQRAVVVQASVHGTDNRAVLDAVARAPGRFRGVAAVGADVTNADLARLHEGGVRGLRINLVDRGGMSFGSLDDVVEVGARIRDYGWHLEFLAPVEEMKDLQGLLARLPVPAVFGHLGYTPAAKGVGHPGFRRFLGLLREGGVWVKLTGPYRISGETRPPYRDLLPFAEALLVAAPERVVWGSDWPHVVQVKPMPNDGDLLDLLAVWAPDEALRRRILVDNPAELYGFRTEEEE